RPRPAAAEEARRRVVGPEQAAVPPHGGGAARPFAERGADGTDREGVRHREPPRPDERPRRLAKLGNPGLPAGLVRGVCKKRAALAPASTFVGRLRVSPSRNPSSKSV